jgi:DNA-binding protein HU-beta
VDHGKPRAARGVPAGSRGGGVLELRAVRCTSVRRAPNPSATATREHVRHASETVCQADRSRSKTPLWAVPRGERLARTDAGKADAQAALDCFTGVVQQQLAKGDEVAITGVGKFSVSKRPARTGRNPQTGESISIKASKAPKFSVGAGLRAAHGCWDGRYCAGGV